MTRSTRSLLGFPFAQLKLAAALIRWSSCHTTERDGGQQVVRVRRAAEERLVEEYCLVTDGRGVS